MTEHVRQLLQEYQRKEEHADPSEAAGGGDGGGGACGGDDVEKYERCIPAHGDSLFHRFVQRIQQNPGQILR